MYSIRFIWERGTAAGRERAEREQAARQQAAREQAARQPAAQEGMPSPVPAFARLSRPRAGRPYAARRIAHIPPRCIALAR